MHECVELAWLANTWQTRLFVSELARRIYILSGSARFASNSWPPIVGVCMDTYDTCFNSTYISSTL